MKNTNYTPAYLVACANIYHLDFIIDSFINSAKLLNKERNGSTYSQAFHMLVSFAFELIPKMMIGIDICKEYEDDNKLSVEDIKELIVQKISNKKDAGHNLKKLLERYPELLNFLGIESIGKVPDGDSKEWFVSEYRIKMKNNDSLICIKDGEAVRYGSFSRNQDVTLGFTDDDEILDLLCRTQEYARRYKNEILNSMKSTI